MIPVRLARTVVIVSRALQAERRLTSASSFRLAALATLFLVVIAGAVQSELDHGEFQSFWDGVWWATVTVTTVGYGDLYPKTTVGRLIGIALMFVGIGFLAVLTATIASYFVRADRAEADDKTQDVLHTLARVEERLSRIEAKLE